VSEWTDGPGLTNGVRAGKCPPGWVGSRGPAAMANEPQVAMRNPETSSVVHVAVEDVPMWILAGWEEVDCG
jgi:hypothetical protein